MRPISATIRAAALRHNLALARRCAPRSRLWAVAKANAYGHGLSRSGSGLAAADGLALLELDAAAGLRDSGYRKPILMLEGFFSEDELAEFRARRLTAVIHHADQLDMLDRAQSGACLDVYLKLNTGMNRLGFDVGDADAVLERMRACANVASITLMTHFAEADAPEGVAGQMSRLGGVAPGIPRCLANSAALLRFPETQGEWVRPGIMLYGCSPFADQSAEAIGLWPAMTLRSRIIAVRDLRAGDRVGYGGTFIAPKPMRIGVIACGYADGYPRHAPGFRDRSTPILVCRRRTCTVGRVSMDTLSADITDLPEAGVGSEVTLWGEGLSADEVAAAAGTVSYELLCALSTRVPIVESE